MFRGSAFAVLVLLLAGPAAAQNDPPFALHAGAVYARLRDVDIAKVQTLAGQELFSQANARDTTTDFAIFLSQRLWTAPARHVRVYGTLGTGLFNEPGSVLHFGGSVAVSRALVTAGVATTLVEQGSGPVVDQVFPGSGERLLFGDVERTREWGFFVAVSVGLVQ